MADLRKAYRRLDPANPSLDFYVTRPGDLTGLLAEEFKLTRSPIRVLLAGQRGVGKTTELLRLERLCGGGTSVVPDLSMVRGAGLFLYVAAAFIWNRYRAEDQNSDVSQWLATLRKQDLDSISVAEGKIAFRKVVEGLSTSEGWQPLLLDGLEKAPPDLAADIAWHLSDVDCSIAMVVPLQVLLSPAYASQVSEWDRRIPLPAIPIRTREGAVDEAGRVRLRDVIVRRAGDDAFLPEALEHIIDQSGGVHRELLTLAQLACVRAATADRSTVTLDDARGAVEDRRLEYSVHLTPRDMELLAEVERTQRITGDPALLTLMTRNLIVGYHSGWAWFDVHPLVKPLLASSRALGVTS